MANPPDRLRNLKGIAVDVFGTAVDWYGTIARFGCAASPVIDWNKFAIDWLTGYRSRVQLVRGGQLPWSPLDKLLSDAFEELKAKYDLSSLTPESVTKLSGIWHTLEPWPDLIPGLARLQKSFRVAALSNGNAALVIDIAKHSGIPWDGVITADLARKYKPDPEVYQLAYESLGPSPEEVIYVAAHKWDLEIGKNLGMRTAYLPRPTEIGPNNPPSDDPSPDPKFDLFVKSFEELADQLMPVAKKVGQPFASRLHEHTGYLKFISLNSSRPKTSQTLCDSPSPSTDPNIEGPYYRPGAPWKSDLAGPSEPGKRMIVRGCVSNNCGGVITDAILDIWQATADGHYDNESPDLPPARDVFRLRGRLKTNEFGRYEFRTIWPGPYPIGEGLWRPSHIHVKIHAAGYPELTTQLYFKGDPYNRNDFAYKPSLELDPVATATGFSACYDFILTSQ